MKKSPQKWDGVFFTIFSCNKLQAKKKIHQGSSIVLNLIRDKFSLRQ